MTNRVELNEKEFENVAGGARKTYGDIQKYVNNLIGCTKVIRRTNVIKQGADAIDRYFNTGKYEFHQTESYEF